MGKQIKPVAVSLVNSSGIPISSGNAHRSLLLAAWHGGRSIRQLDWTRERSASAWGEGTGTVPGSSCHGYCPGNAFRLILDQFLPWERKTGKGPKDKRAIFVYFPLQPSALSVPIRPKEKCKAVLLTNIKLACVSDLLTLSIQNLLTFNHRLEPRQQRETELL